LDVESQLSPDYPSVAGCVVGSADGWHVTQTLPGLRAAAWAARRSLACSPGAPPPVKGSQSTGVRNFGRISLRAVLCRERAVHTGTEAFSIGRGRPVMQLFTGISELVVNDLDALDELDTVTDAALLIDDGRVVWSGPSTLADTAVAEHFGASEERPGGLGGSAPAAPRPEVAAVNDADIVNGEVTSVGELAELETIDLGGKAVIPGFVDSHNHLVFAGDRSEEFAARMTGQKYSAGGIATTVAATRAATEDELEGNLVHLLEQARRQGTTTFEIKSGYGLTVADEIRALDIINRHTEESTLIAAHVVPPEYKDDPEGYVDLVIDEIIPAAQGKAKWIDAFCETGAFTEDQTKRIIAAGKAAGMKPRLHANQLTEGGA